LVEWFFFFFLLFFAVDLVSRFFSNPFVVLFWKKEWYVFSFFTVFKAVFFSPYIPLFCFPHTTFRPIFRIKKIFQKKKKNNKKIARKHKKTRRKTRKKKKEKKENIPNPAK